MIFGELILNQMPVTRVIGLLQFCLTGINSFFFLILKCNTNNGFAGRLNVFFSNGRLDAFQFHTANVVLHGLLSIMTLPFFECLLKRRRTRKTLAPLDDPAFTGALLFAVHPVHTEVLT